MPRILTRIIVPVAILIAWKLATAYGHIHPLILPGIDSVVHDFLAMTKSGELFFHTLASLKRYAVGLIAGCALGITGGMVIGWFPLLENLLDIPINFMRSIPKTALAPFLIVWFGFGDMPKVLLIGLASFFYTVIPTIEGVKNVEYHLIKSARSMGANNRQILFTVILPAAMPAMCAGIRLASSTALVVLVFVEIVSGNDGLGYLLETSRGSLNMPTMLTALFVLGIIGFFIDWFVRASEKILMPWRKGKTVSF
jgi:sulfonate transport system permease protein